MEWSKIKNIILVILLTANAFLLLLVLNRETASRRYEDQARDEIVAILARGGITLAKETMPEEMTLNQCSVPRSLEAEAAWATALLGDATRTQAEGRYTSSRGSLRFYPDGAFSLTAGPDAPSVVEGDFEEAAASLLARLGITVGQLEITTQEEATAPPLVVVTAQPEYQGTPVFLPRPITVTFRGDQLTGAEGYVLSGTPQEEASTEPLSVVSILRRFLGYWKENRLVGQEITAMQAGYTLTTSPGSAPRLIPTWRITTDSGAYSLHALTGEIL